MVQPTDWDFSGINNAVSGVTKAVKAKNATAPAGAQPVSADDLYGYLGPSQQAQTIGALNAQPVAAQPVAQPQTIANLVPLFIRGR